MEQLPVRFYAAGIGLASLMLFTGVLGWGHADRVRFAAALKEAAAAKPAVQQQAAKPKPAAAPPAESKSEPAKEHVVREGETLWGIASANGVNLKDLLALNPDVSPEHLQIGQELKLPPYAKSSPLPDDDDVMVAALKGKFIWPVVAPITSKYGPRWGRIHAGLDLGAFTGDPIKAARDGEVVFSGEMSGYGQTIILKHADGTRTLYAHASKLIAAAGKQVKQGETIALVGSTGHSTGPHLHFEIIVNDRARDPELYLPTLR